CRSSSTAIACASSVSRCCSTRAARTCSPRRSPPASAATRNFTAFFAPCAVRPRAPTCASAATGRTARLRPLRSFGSGALPPFTRRNTDVALERAAEARFRRVADGIGHLGHAGRARAELPARELQAERREVAHRCLPDELLEALGEHGA